jgi:predicted O-methyltransferase YrrM
MRKNLTFRQKLHRAFEDRPADRDLPVYMHPVEFSQFQAILHSIEPRNFLEWGSGGSTREILEICPYIERFVSIEHHEGWATRVREAVDDDRLHLAHVAARIPGPDRFPKMPREHRDRIRAWEALCETDRTVMADYIDYPRGLGLVFDMALVDGRARVFCLETAWELVRSGGVVVIHDAEREVYHPTLHRLGRPVFLKPWYDGQIAFVRKP